MTLSPGKLSACPSVSRAAVLRCKSHFDIRHNLHERTMAKHHPDLVMCRKQPGVAVGRLCEKCMYMRGNEEESIYQPEGQK